MLHKNSNRINLSEKDPPFFPRMTLGLFMRMMIRNGMICIDSAHFTDFTEMIFGHIVG